jgi:SAM-dependent methyltransferase
MVYALVLEASVERHGGSSPLLGTISMENVMSHSEQIEYIKKIRNRFPSFFKNRTVLEVGSLNINGTVRDFFENCNYTGIDVGPGPGVDIVCGGQEYNAPKECFDVVISCECFEHNPYWVETFLNMVRMCKSGGLVIVTCASTGRPEHGTNKSNPSDSPLTVSVGWGDYYKNLTEVDFKNAFDIEEMFSIHKFEFHDHPGDLHFCGLKK